MNKENQLINFWINFRDHCDKEKHRLEGNKYSI